MDSGTLSVVHKASSQAFSPDPGLRSFPNTRQALTRRGDVLVLLPLSGTLAQPPLLPTAPAPLRSHGNIPVFQNWV